MKLPFLFEYLDPVAMIGYPHTVYTAFSAEETLLARTEAYIMKEKYQEAVRDFNIWIKANTKSAYVLKEAGKFHPILTVRPPDTNNS